MTINKGRVDPNAKRANAKEAHGTTVEIFAKRIFKAVADGCSREAAAALAGINVATLYDWQNKIPEFSEGLKKADARLNGPPWRASARRAEPPATGPRTRGFLNGNCRIATVASTGT